jgi:ABC-type dipeptide/oligopeptide/nickel transport systems, permease components
VARFIVRRLLVAIPVLFGLSVILFLFLRLLPGGGPAEAILGQHATPQLVAQIAASEGLDKPLYVQYFDYLGRLLHGDFGASFIDGREVAATFLIRFPATLELTIGALIFAVGLGIPLGRLAARHPNGWIDGIVTVISLFGISIPVFVLGYTLAFIFGVEFHLLPTFGQLDPRLPIEPVTHFALIDAILAGHWYVIDAVAHLILPSVALGTIPLAVFTRITRASVIEVSNEDYVRPPGKGPDRQAGQRPPHHAQRLAAGDHRHRPGDRSAAGRCRADRDRLLLEWGGLLGRQLHPEPRLHRRPVADPDLRHDLPRSEPDRGRGLRLPQPAHQVQLRWRRPLP